MSESAAQSQTAEDYSGTLVEGQASSLKRQKRDRVLDVMRGWAVVLMVFSHVAPSTISSTLAHLPFWISAADSFILISGIVLGVRSFSRVTKSSRLSAYAHIWRRAFELWLVHCVLMLAVVSVHEITGKLDVASIESVGGFWKALGMILVLRFQSNDFMNILPLFILFLLAAPIGLEACRRGYTWLWLGASMLLWAVAQHEPNVLPLLHPASGKIVFSIGAWQFIFCIGLAIGFHRETRLIPFWTRNKHWFLPAVLTLAGVIFTYAQLQRDILGLGLGLPESWQWLFAKQTWAPVRAVYTLATLFITYLGLRVVMASKSEAQGVLSFGQRYILEPLELMGQKSLYCFVMHLLFALTAAAFATTTWTWWFQELFVVVAILGLYELAKRGIFAKLIPA